MDAAGLIELKDVLGFYQTQYEATDRLWTYFATVSLALVGYSLGSDRLSRSIVETFVAVAAYVIFCIGNHAALSAAQEQLVSLAALARQKGAGNLHIVLSPFTTQDVNWYYWSVVVAVCMVLVVTCWLHRSGRTAGALMATTTPP